MATEYTTGKIQATASFGVSRNLVGILFHAIVCDTLYERS